LWAGVTRPTMKVRTLMGRQGRRRLVLPFVLPALILYSMFFMYPALRAFWVSLHDWTGFGSNMVYIGLGNYRQMWNDGLFWASFRRTLVISVGGGIGIFALALLFAGILQRNLRGDRFFRAVVFFPIVIPGVGVGLIWQFIYNNQWGPLSSFLQGVGLGALDRTWLGPQNIIQSLTVAVIWTYVGYYMVILRAGMDKIPPTYYEAARLDGASEWMMFFRITIPMIWDVLIIAVVLWVVGSLKIFDIIAATTFPAPPQSTYTLTIYIWTQAVGSYTPVYRLGYATALGVVLLIMIVAVVAIVRFGMRREAIEY
jgi:ABC-type sugar transport system permease subunit